MRILSLCLALMLLLSSCALAQNTPAPNDTLSDYGYVQSNLGQVNLRAKASARSERIMLLENYDQARILGTERGDDGKTWYHVEFEGREGYIHGDYFIVMTKREMALRQGDSQLFLSPDEDYAAAAGEDIIEPSLPVPTYVSQLIYIAEKELGYQEDASGMTKYGVWSGDSRAEWCAEYLCWCLYQTDKLYGTHLLNSIYPHYTGNNTGRDWFLQQGRYVARRGFVPGWGSQWYKGESTVMPENSYIPQPGDWLFLSTASTGDTIHVAMVTYCTYDENGKVLVHVLEGNNPDKVQRNAYPLDYWAILGYGTVHDVADITLKEGHKGEKVKALQQKLYDAGFTQEQYITGTYGDITVKAVQDFQTAMGLTATGIANQETQLRLEKYLAVLQQGNQN